jgi:hypothetical protein
VSTPGDPVASFRKVMVATLILESIVVALALPVIARLGAGIGTGQGWLVISLAVAMLLACGVVRYPWGTGVVLGLQVVMVACGFFVVALGALGLIFGAVWAWLLWLRHDVLRRRASAHSADNPAGSAASSD